VVEDKAFIEGYFFSVFRIQLRRPIENVIIFSAYEPKNCIFLIRMLVTVFNYFLSCLNSLFI
jgi:hypothetical protein